MSSDFLATRMEAAYSIWPKENILMQSVRSKD